MNLGSRGRKPTAQAGVLSIHHPDKQHFRQKMHALRAALTPTQVQRLSQAICHHTGTMQAFLSARRISAYIPVRNEVDPTPLFQQIQHRGATLYLPITQTCPRRLILAPWQPGDPLIRSRLGILEPPPSTGTLDRPDTLDIILMPLVGFDAQGGRLGYGGGYYDRFLSLRSASTQSMNPDRQPIGPLRIGLAYAFQECPGGLPPAPHDIPLNGVITENGPLFFNHS